MVVTAVNFGVFLDKSMRLEITDFTVTVLLGLLGISIVGASWAIFFRLNIEFHWLLLVMNLVIYIVLNRFVNQRYRDLRHQLMALPKSLKILLSLLTVLTIAQCSALPFIIDNETYYVQTIKWLNEYGLVEGLGNLHIFLAQTSGWHILQSVFSFSFLYGNYNDLSGFCLLLGNFYAITHLAAYFENADKSLAAIGLFVLFNPLLFQFISAPSPDMPIFVISFILFSMFLQNFKKPSAKQINQLLLLAFFIGFIKPTAVVIALLPAILLFRNAQLQVSKMLPTVFVCVCIAGLFVAKNVILTGYPLYPTLLAGPVNVDFAVPQELISFYFGEARRYGFFLTKAEFDAMTASEIFFRWINVSKINGAFNVLSLLLVAIVPFFIGRFYNKKALWILYFLMVLQLALLLATSPQFRFFLNFILFFGGFITVCLFGTRRGISVLYGASSIILAVLVFFSIDVSAITQNKLFSTTKNFRFQNLVFPASNSNLNEHHLVTKGNLKYHSPDKNVYFWYGGNGALPCVNTQQIDYFELNFNFIPQQRNASLKEGFRSVKATRHDP